MVELKCRRRNGAGVLQKLRGEYILHHWTGRLCWLWSAMVGYGRLVVDAFGVATKHTRTMNTCGNAETTVTFMHPSCAIRSDAILETNHANHCKSIYEK